MKFYNDFIGDELDNVSTDFISSDTKQRYLKNRKDQKSDWPYHDYNIKYDLNELGHRCKSIKDLQKDNYILFLGCSNTMGVGLKIEHSFPYIISKELNCDYYNLSVAGTGIDIIEHNLFIWLQKIKEKPKTIILQYPDHSRFTGKNLEFTNLLPYGSWSREQDVIEFIFKSDSSYHNHARKFYIENLIDCATSNLKFVKVQQASLKHYDNTSLFWPRNDFARDLIHPGIKSHQYISKLILENLR